MALSKQELEELESLRAEFKSPSRQPGQVSEMNYSVGGAESGASQAPAQKSTLSKEEEAELFALRQEFSAPQAPSSFMDRAQTQLESFGNSVTLGYLPQIQAGFEKVNNFISDPSGGVDAQLEAQGFQLPKQDYVNLRDENIKRQQGQAERNPYDAAAGMIAGIGVQAPLLAGAVIPKAAGMAGRVGSSIATGFSLGAASNPGDTEGQVNPLQGQERLSNAAMGGALGAGGQLVGEGVARVGSAVKNSPVFLDKVSKIKAFKAAGATLKDFRSARGNNSPEAIGETLLSKNIVSAGDSLEDIASKLSAARKETGQSIRDVYSRVKDSLSGNGAQSFTPKEVKFLNKTKIDGKKIADEARVKILDAFKNNLGNTEEKKKVLTVLDDLAAMGDNIDINDALEAKINIDAQMNYSKKINELPIVQQQLKTVRDYINKSIQDNVRAVGIVIKDKGLVKQLKTANKEYGQIATAERFAVDKVSRDSANQFFSLGDNLSGGAGATIGAASGDSLEEKVKNGLIGYVTGRVANKYGRASLPIISRSAKLLGESLKKPAALAKYGEPLIEAAKRSPQEFQALLNQFGKDPEFIRITESRGAR